MMGRRSVELDEEAYQLLQRQRLDGENFSDVVKRLTGERSWNEVVGILDDDEADALETAIESGRSRGSSTE
jgi:predicted CopG family antitoxin